MAVPRSRDFPQIPSTKKKSLELYQFRCTYFSLSSIFGLCLFFWFYSCLIYKRGVYLVEILTFLDKTFPQTDEETLKTAAVEKLLLNSRTRTRTHTHSHTYSHTTHTFTTKAVLKAIINDTARKGRNEGSHVCNRIFFSPPNQKKKTGKTEYDDGNLFIFERFFLVIICRHHWARRGSELEEETHEDRTGFGE
ncbi:hypothetical protein GGR50DRAFT_333820 [Xylaria sp. CBS 124048]|nr:hypothetical protein GGR50DRAFT_333820 [Xylaria sp. CBS 124048]